MNAQLLRFGPMNLPGQELDLEDEEWWPQFGIFVNLLSIQSKSNQNMQLLAGDISSMCWKFLPSFLPSFLLSFFLSFLILSVCQSLIHSFFPSFIHSFCQSVSQSVSQSAYKHEGIIAEAGVSLKGFVRMSFARPKASLVIFVLFFVMLFWTQPWFHPRKWCKSLRMAGHLQVYPGWSFGHGFGTSSWVKCSCWSSLEDKAARGFMSYKNPRIFMWIRLHRWFAEIALQGVDQHMEAIMDVSGKVGFSTRAYFGIQTSQEKNYSGHCQISESMICSMLVGAEKGWWKTHTKSIYIIERQFFDSHVEQACD